MSAQSELFTLTNDGYRPNVPSAEARDEAVDRGYANAHAQWKAEALKCVRRLALTLREFTIDDLDPLLAELAARGITTHNQSARAGLMRTAASKNTPEGQPYCRYSGRDRPSRRVHMHATKLGIYESLIFQE